VASYNLGYVVDRKRKPLPRSKWTFPIIEVLFDLVRDHTRSTQSGYQIYGHSAGGQFVERLVTILPDARFDRAVAANAGWYTLPTFEQRFPYGLEGSPVTRRQLGEALQRDLTIVVGELDTDGTDPTLRTTRKAMLQGRNRLERARRFFDVAEESAARLGVALRWRLIVAPDVGHDNAAIASIAANELCGAVESLPGELWHSRHEDDEEDLPKIAQTELPIQHTQVRVTA
jgi:pimeloyl-ACP methyl ester carboxylesterase